MPVRNAEQWLGEALRSIGAQTLDDWDLFVVDDGSSDASRALLDSYADSNRRVRVMATRGNNRGIVSALNIALEQATGEFVARMDADDFSDPLRLQLQVEALENEPELAATTCRVEPLVEHGGVTLKTNSLSQRYQGMERYLAWQNELLDPADLFRDRFVECPLVHPTLMMRTERLRDELGGWQQNGWAEDWDLVLRAFGLGWRFRRLPEVLYCWRLHAKQSMRTDSIYSAVKFRAARSHYLSRHLRTAAFQGRKLWILGAGPTGKLLARGLYDQGVSVDGLADIDPRKVGGRIHYRDNAWPVLESNELFEIKPRPFALSAVGSAAGRARVRAFLSAHGWQEGHDFLAAA